MSDNGAYDNEMNDVALFENALRAAMPTPPDPRLGATLVPRLAEVARASSVEGGMQTTRRRMVTPRSRFALVARVGIAVALIPLALAGLAFAGVTVPGPARSVFHSVGITLPNQPAKHAKAHADQASPPAEDTVPPLTATPKETEGNSAPAHTNAREQHSKARGKAKGHEIGKAIGLNGSTPPGQAKEKETGPPSHSKAGGNSESHTTTHVPPGHATHPPHGNANGHSK